MGDAAPGWAVAWDLDEQLEELLKNVKYAPECPVRISEAVKVK